MNRVFISHSSKQSDLVDRIVKDLGRDYCIVDRFDFEITAKIESEIKTKIDQSAVFCLLVSKDSIESDWVKLEENYAKGRIESGNLIFVCFIVDPGVKVSDRGISDWERAYILETIPSAKLIARVIKAKLREVDVTTYQLLKLRDTLFYGRGPEMNELENSQVIKAAEGCKSVIISGLPNVGKKRFAREALRKISCDPRLWFCSVQLTKDQSIEDLVFYLNDYVEKFSVPELTKFLAEKDMKWKRDVAIDLLNILYSFRQHLLILDNYCIVRHDGRITDWFISLLQSEKLEKTTGIYITTPRRVSPLQIDSLPLVHQMLSPLNNNDMRVLFQSYSSKRGLQIPASDIIDFSSQIGGFPGHVYLIVDEWVKSGKSGARLKMESIIAKTEDVLSQIVDMLNTESDEVEVLVLLAKCDVISISQLNSLFPNKDIDRVLDSFYGMSILEYFGYSKEYVRIHPVVADYINRSKKLSITSDIVKLLSEKAASLITDVNATESDEDLPMYLFGIKSTLKNGLSSSRDISRYMVPSLALSVIVEEYESRNYQGVLTLCQRMIERSKNYDKHILRSVHYWYCLALCRLKKNELLREVEYFMENSPSRHFLLGFYYRQQGKIKKAKEEFEKSLRLSSTEAESTKTKQELVVVKIMLDDYDGALTMAEENYRNQPHNAFFIEAYFRCLVRHIYADSEVLLNLIEEMKRSQDKYREAIAHTMRAEYVYYRDGRYFDAIHILQRTIEFNSSLKYPKDALRAICGIEKDSATFLRIQEELKKEGIVL